LAETAKAKGIDFYQYLVTLMTELPNLPIHLQPEILKHALVEKNPSHMYRKGALFYILGLLYIGESVAQTIDSTQDTSFVLDTFYQLPDLPQGCILHSDQGSVYTSYAYQKSVKEKGITISMSRKGTPTDNSPIETFYLDGIYRTTNAHMIQIVED